MKGPFGGRVLWQRPLQILVDGSENRSDSHSLDAVVGSVETVQELNRHYWCTIELSQTPDIRPPVEKWIAKGNNLRAIPGDHA